MRRPTPSATQPLSHAAWGTQSPVLLTLALGLLLLALNCLPAFGQGKAFLRDAPKDPVVDEVGLLDRDQKVTLREQIADLAETRQLHVYVVVNDFADKELSKREALNKVHFWAPAGYAAIVMFSNVPGVEPLVAYSQDLTVRLSDSGKADIMESMLARWRSAPDPSEKVVVAGLDFLRNEELWLPWFKEKVEGATSSLRAVEISSKEITDEEGLEERIKRPEALGGNAEKVAQRESVFFDWQKQMILINIALILLIVGGAVWTYIGQRRASNERESQMRRGAELLSPIEPARRSPPPDE